MYGFNAASIPEGIVSGNDVDAAPPEAAVQSKRAKSAWKDIVRMLKC